MPRQAARLVLGRSARASPTTAATTPFAPLHCFSTTPRRFDDGSNNDGSNNDGNNNDGSGNSNFTRAVRTNAAASALSKLNTSAFSGNLAQVGGRPVLDLKRLPPKAERPPAQLNRSGDTTASTFARFAPAPGSAAQDSGAGGRDSSYGRGGYRGGSFAGRGGGARGTFRRGGRRGRSSRDRGGRTGAGRKGAEGEEDEEDDEEKQLDSAEKEAENARRFGEELIKRPEGGFGNRIDRYMENERIHGPETEYNPSTTLESLIQWAPAVATNNALGQVAMAARSMRIVGGGRQFHEREQTFDNVDEVRWRSVGKPIFYSRVEQKEAALKMLNPERRERRVQEAIDEFVWKLQQQHGENYSAFAEDYDALGEREIRRRAEEKVDASFQKLVNDKSLKMTKNKTTREAIAKFVLRGDHPDVEIAEDIYSKAARYHAQTPTYTPTDGEKFDAKLKDLVRS